jgi:hypothetical protein
MRLTQAFVNPANSDRYEWHMNHAPDGEEHYGEVMNITESASTSGTGVVRQQGANTPLRIKLRGTILNPTQHDAMVDWARLGQSQTIYFEMFNGEEYEVLIRRFESAKQGVVRNPRGGSVAPLHKWEYQIEMDVIAVRAGTWL